MTSLKKSGFRFPTRLEWLFSLKAFIASMVALYVALKLELPRPYWAMATVYVVSNPFVGATRSKAVYRALGTAIGAAAAVILLPPFVEQPLVFSAVVACWSGSLLFLSMHDRTARGYVFVLAGYTMPLVALSAVDAPYTVFEVAVSRTEEIIVGIVCASVVGSILFPVSLSSSLTERTNTWFLDAGKFGLACLTGDPRTGALPALRRRLVSTSNSLEFLVSQLSYDHASPPIIRLAKQLLSRMQLLVITGSALADLGIVVVRRTDVENNLDKAIELVAARFRDRGHPRSPFVELRNELETLRSECIAADEMQASTLAGIFRRLQQLAAAWEDCLSLNDAIRNQTPNWKPSFRHWRADAARPYRDTPMLVFSAVTVVIGVFVACCLWIYSGWTDGALGVTLATVSCCFFAMVDDPGSQIKQYFVAVCGSIVLAAFYLVAVVPHVQDFPMLVVILFVPFLLIGTMIPRPRYAIGTLLAAVNFATFLSIQSIYDIDFSSFLNLNIAGPVGLLFALLWTRLTKPFGTELMVSRHTRKAWADIVAACSTRPVSNQRRFAGLVVDRLMQVLQRQAGVRTDDDHESSQTLRDARIIFSVLDLRRAGKRLSVEVQGEIRCVMRDLRTYFDACIRHRRREPVPAELLDSIEAALRRVSCPTSGQIQSATAVRFRDDAAIFLTDLRSALARTTSRGLG